jgi:(4-(4-[2-(gamma-L-glutamylamino)ethyl]phenoxymethyl)furan-2-yl)methanamine synthase
MIADSTAVIGWDVGGAHLKACLVVQGEVVDVAQWP